MEKWTLWHYAGGPLPGGSWGLHKDETIYGSCQGPFAKLRVRLYAWRHGLGFFLPVHRES
jgi:hypothetical protein